MASDPKPPAATPRGRFICLEGIEGVGKTSHLQAIVDHLQARGIPAIRTREPGGTDLGEAVRGLLLSRDYPPMHPDTELLLMFAARAEHLRHHILPALEAGTWVISDRFTDATYAYQGGGREIPASRIAVLEDWVQGPWRPDLTLLLDAPVETGLARARRRGEGDRFEQETLAFFERVRRVYQDRAQRDPGRYTLIDATGPLQAVRRTVLERVDALCDAEAPA